MTVPTAVTDLSTTAASNPPAGSDSPTTTDDHFRAAYSLIRGNYNRLTDGTLPITCAALTATTGTFSSNVSIAGAFSANGGATLGDASGDSLTINSATASIPNGLNLSGGNVGISVSPSAWGAGIKALQFSNYGSVYDYNGGTFGSVANLYFDGTNWKYRTTNAASAYLQTVSSGQHEWHVAAGGAAGATATLIRAMTLDNSGNLLLGVTTYALANANALMFSASNGMTYSMHASGTASGAAYHNFAYNAVTIGSITQSGTTAVLYNTTSDQRLKENIVDAPDCGATIDAIRVRSFDWKGIGEHVEHGFIAQELVTHAPQAVKVGDDGPEVVDQWAVDPAKLVPLLVRELQSVRARVAALEGK